MLAIEPTNAKAPPPHLHPDTAEFWNRASEGEFVLPRCDDCGTVRFPVEPVCWHCLSPRATYVAGPTEGVVAAMVAVERATGRSPLGEDLPYLAGLIDMGDGLRLSGRVLCRCGAAGEPGCPVRMCRVSTTSHLYVFAFAHDCGVSDER